MEFLVILLFAVAALLVAMHYLKKSSGQTDSTHPSNDYSHLYGAPVQPTAPKQDAPEQTVPERAAPVPPAKPVPLPKPPVPKKPFSPIALLLVAGVVFLFLGGVIFLTSTWDMLPDVVRALSLLSASAAAFGINILAERVLRLPKTGLAFYILGCIFLPLALGGIGAFSLLGEWFSFSGDGCMLLLSLMAACVSATSFLGQSNYKSAVLGALGLTGLGGAWMFLCLFILFTFADSAVPFFVVASVFMLLLAGFAVLMTWIAHCRLRRADAAASPLFKAWVPYLYIQNCVFTALLMLLLKDAPICTCIGAVVMAALFLNERFILKTIHTGVFGFASCVLLALSCLCSLELFQYAPAYEVFLFIMTAAVFLLLCIAAMPKLRSETRVTMGFAGMILCIPTIPTALVMMLINMDGIGQYFLFLFIPLLIAAVQFAFSPHNPLSKDTPHFLLSATLLYSISMMMTEDSMLLRLLLVFAALILLAQSFLNKRLWPLVLSICTCAAAAVQSLPYSGIWITCLCALALLTGMVYAHFAKRPVLERCCGLAGIPFLLTGVCSIFLLRLDTIYAQLLTLALLALIYLAESIFLRHQLHAAFIRSFCLNLAVFFGIFAAVEISLDPLGIGWLLLLVLTLIVLTCGNLRRGVNLAAMPMMIYLFVAIRELILSMEHIPTLSEGWLLGLQIAGYVLMLLLFAGMGRVLLPHGFYNTAENRTQVDWGLLAGVLPIFSVASTIDWYPSILCCLLLSVYSLLFIGRVKTHYFPILLASAFGCLTIFFHNVNDPFGILEIWHNADFKAPQILLYLLPMHVFIASLLLILPQKYRDSVHMARFIMYCFTMLCILVASLSFNRAEDGIVLAAFSLFILVGSFFVKRLRWFALGFSVLFLMTIKLTWEFWRSLHWGIYLFLAGAVLIGIAFYYEYAVRRADEKTEKGEPIEKFRIFKEWKF